MWSEKRENGNNGLDNSIQNSSKNDESEMEIDNIQLESRASRVPMPQRRASQALSKGRLSVSSNSSHQKASIYS
jgi:hypothetical protein